MLRTAVQIVALLVMLAILAGVLLMLFAFASLVSVPGQVSGGLGGVTSQASRVADSVGQAVQNVTDPNHPPVGLIYDNEFSTLQVLRVGEPLPGGSQYVLTLQAIRRREPAETPDTAQFAVVHAELRQPRETRVLGQLIRSDPDGHDYVVYKGEAFRIGRSVYRVNWISQEETAIGAGVLRHPDA